MIFLHSKFLLGAAILITCSGRQNWQVMGILILTKKGTMSRVEDGYLCLHIMNSRVQEWKIYVVDCSQTCANCGFLKQWLGEVLKFLQNIAKLVSDFISLFLNKGLSRTFRRRSCFYHRRWTWHSTCDLGSRYLWFISHLYCWLLVRFTSWTLYLLIFSGFQNSTSTWIMRGYFHDGIK